MFEWNEEVDDLRERLRIVGGRDALAGFVKVSPAAVARRLVLDEGISCLLPVLTVQRDLERGELIPLEPEGAVSYSGS